MIELRGWLVVPGGPRPAAVDRDRGTLVGREQHHVRMQRIDPDSLVVVAAGRSFERGPRAAAIF